MSKPSVTCPACQKRFAHKAELAGKRVKCPACGAGIQIPAQSLFEELPPPSVSQGGAAPADGAAPPDSNYDLADPVPQREAPPSQRFRAAVPVKNIRPDARTITKSMVKSTALVGSRFGLMGLILGPLIGGLVVAVNQNPTANKIAGKAFKGLAIVFLILAGTVVAIALLLKYQPRGGWSQPRTAAQHSPGGQSPMPPPPPGFRQPVAPISPFKHPVPSPVTYEELVARFGADHVVRMKALNVTQPELEEGEIHGVIGTIGPRSSAVTLHDGEFDCVFAINVPFERFLKRLPPGVIVTSDSADLTLTVKMSP